MRTRFGKQTCLFNNNNNINTDTGVGGRGLEHGVYFLKSLVE